MSDSRHDVLAEYYRSTNPPPCYPEDDASPWLAMSVISDVEAAGLILSLPPAPGQHSPACAHPHGNTCHPACPTCYGVEQ
jgi:hypothetical protein